MKPLFKIYLCLFASLCFIAACDDSDEEGISGFTIDAQEFTLGATGGMESVKVASGTKWVAKVNQPWVKVMPANGVGSTNCEIVVDSTLSNDVRHAVVTFVPEGQSKQELKIHQTGYGKMIGLDKYEVEVASMANEDKRYFDISVTTNVKFKVDYPLMGSWVTTSKRQPDISLDYGARPRTIKMRFKWDMNTDPKERIASIKFLPVNEEDELEKEVALTIKQEASPEITDDRRGDSIAIVIASTKLRSMISWDTSERLDYWAGITVWERTDKGVTPEQIGRVRSVEFKMLNTKEELPAEIGKIKYLETLVVASNTNTQLLPATYRIGNALKGLQHTSASDHLLTEISVNHGEHKQVTLPDGTVVHLNAGTVMRYPTEFTSDIRLVEMEGEAFFNVMRDEGKPFIVRTRQADVKVLGTSFNVKAYQEDELMAVSVRTGKVEVDMPESVMRLLPNEQIIVNNTNGEILKKNEDAQKVTAWLQGGLYFNRTPISSVIHDLERMYNQEIVLDPNVVFDDYIYGEHDNKSLEAVLNAIQYSTGIRYRKEESRIVLYKTSH